MVIWVSGGWREPSFVVIIFEKGNFGESWRNSKTVNSLITALQSLPISHTLTLLEQLLAKFWLGLTSSLLGMGEKGIAQVRDFSYYAVWMLPPLLKGKNHAASLCKLHIWEEYKKKSYRIRRKNIANILVLLKSTRIFLLTQVKAK